MKAHKMMLPLVAALFAALPASAQILGMSKPTTIGYETSTLTEEKSGVEYKSSLGFALTQGRSFYVGPSLLNIMRFGIDARWMDISYNRYKKGKVAGDGTDAPADGDISNPDEGGNNDWSTNLIDRISLGKHRLAYNLGVGPAVKITPLGMLHNPLLKKLKVTGYFHWKPGYQVLLFTGGKTEVSHGVMLRNYGIGANIAIGPVGIGVEHNWGWSKLNNWQYGKKSEADDTPADGQVETETDKRIKYKLGSTRVYVGIRF